jgi:hypothetical protein
MAQLEGEGRLSWDITEYQKDAAEPKKSQSRGTSPKSVLSPRQKSPTRGYVVSLPATTKEGWVTRAQELIRLTQKRVSEQRLPIQANITKNVPDTTTVGISYTVSLLPEFSLGPSPTLASAPPIPVRTFPTSIRMICVCFLPPMCAVCV